MAQWPLHIADLPLGQWGSGVSLSPVCFLSDVVLREAMRNQLNQPAVSSGVKCDGLVLLS